MFSLKGIGHDLAAAAAMNATGKRLKAICKNPGFISRSRKRNAAGATNLTGISGLFIFGSREERSFVFAAIRKLRPRCLQPLCTSRFRRKNAPSAMTPTLRITKTWSKKAARSYALAVMTVNPSPGPINIERWKRAACSAISPMPQAGRNFWWRRKRACACHVTPCGMSVWWRRTRDIPWRVVDARSATIRTPPGRNPYCALRSISRCRIKSAPSATFLPIRKSHFE